MEYDFTNYIKSNFLNLKQNKSPWGNFMDFPQFPHLQRLLTYSRHFVTIETHGSYWKYKTNIGNYSSTLALFLASVLSGSPLC